MATIAKGYTFGSTEQVTNAKLHELVDNSTISAITNLDIATGADIEEAKIKLDGSSIVTAATNQVISGEKTFNNPTTIYNLYSSLATIGNIVSSNITASLATIGTLNISTLRGSFSANQSLVSIASLNVTSLLGGLFGAWVNKSADYAEQQVATDGFVVAYLDADSESFQGFTDANSNPTTRRAYIANGTETGERYKSATMPVKKGDYWKATVSGTPVIYWIPMGA